MHITDILNPLISRRDFLKYSGQASLSVGLAPLASSIMNREMIVANKAVRCINVVNFIRAIEPRFKTDLLLPVQKQMEIIKGCGLPATWLLQFDALVSGPFVQYLKDNMPAGHEVGFWFEMNEMHCKAAGVNWRGRPGFEWDHYPNVAFTIGYSPEERMKLADTAMAEFKRIWGKYPKSVASWNLDAITCAHLSDKYNVDAFAVCRDQIATDGFTIWGSPIAGYYPGKTNCWSPAVDPKNQINTPIFRMLGQDPVYYYNREYTMPDGKRHSAPDTMEPVWPSGKSPTFVKEFLKMISEAPTGQFAYAQLGQENSFPWNEQEPGYAPQMMALAKLQKSGLVHVETMGDSGRRFKMAFKTTPVQAQVQLADSFGNMNPEEKSIWYQSKYYRANLHFHGDLPFLRDITVYSDKFPQPFLTNATTARDVEQKMPPVLDGYHWKKSGVEIGSGGFFVVDGKRLTIKGQPKITEDKNILVVSFEVTGGKRLSVIFEQKMITFDYGSATGNLELSFEWDTTKSSLVEVTSQTAKYKFHELDYSVRVSTGRAEPTSSGWKITGKDGVIMLGLSQT